jgi:hypothetical protein
MAIVATWYEFESGAPETAADAAMLWPGVNRFGPRPAPPAGQAVLPDRIPGHDAARRQPETASLCPVLAGCTLRARARSGSAPGPAGGGARGGLPAAAWAE